LQFSVLFLSLAFLYVVSFLSKLLFMGLTEKAFTPPLSCHYHPAVLWINISQGLLPAYSFFILKMLYFSFNFIFVFCSGKIANILILLLTIVGCFC
jgi:hypothetical protein